MLEFENEEGQLAVDVLETQVSVIIRTAVAGVKLSDLDIHVTTDLVTIRGTRKEEADLRNATVHFQECFWGTFSRSVILPHHVNPEGAEAHIKDGVLTLTIPKTRGDMHVQIRQEQ